MKNIILSFILIFPFVVFGQIENDTIVYDSFSYLENNNLITNEVDLIEERRDSLFANTLGVDMNFNNPEFNEGKYLIVFYEYDNLLLIVDEKTQKQKITFLTFRVETIYNNFMVKYFMTDKGDFVELRYHKEGDVIKLLAIDIQQIVGINSNSLTYFTK